MTVNRCASLDCTVDHVVELSPMPWISSNAGPEPAIRNARRYPWIVRKSKVGVNSRTERRLGLRSVGVIVANFVVGPAPTTAGSSGAVVVPERILGFTCLFSEETFELRAELVTAGKVFIPGQQ